MKLSRPLRPRVNNSINGIDFIPSLVYKGLTAIISIPVLVSLASGCLLSSNPITFTAEAVGEKIINNAVKRNLRPLHDKVDNLLEVQKTQGSTIRLLTETFARDRDEWRSFKNVMYGANKESARLHTRWERYIVEHRKRLAAIEMAK